MELECPSCYERINREELINGRCPICRWRHEETLWQDEVEATLFAQFCRLVENIEDTLDSRTSSDSRPRYRSGIGYEVLEGRTGNKTQYSFDLSASTVDKIKLKKCASCGKRHVKTGSKLLQVRIFAQKTTHQVIYKCPKCAHQPDLT